MHFQPSAPSLPLHSKWIRFCLNFYILPPLFVFFFGMPFLNLYSASSMIYLIRTTLFLVSRSPERESLVHCPYKTCSNTHCKRGWAISRYAPWSLRRSAMIAARASSCLSGSFRTWLSNSFFFCFFFFFYYHFFFYDSWKVSSSEALSTVRGVWCSAQQ